MLVVDLNGNKQTWKVKGDEIVLDKRARSSLHKHAREILKSKYPTTQILEEVQFSPLPKKILYFDFYFPLRKVAIEVHGEQHFKFSSLFHSTQFDFLQQKKNDNIKREWCDINNIKLIELKYNDISNWENLI